VVKSLPENLYSPDAVARLDQLAIKENGIPGYTLMRRAGQAVFDCLNENYASAKNILVFCGAGNNAGDGYVVARLVHNKGVNVKVVSLIDPKLLKHDALQAYQHWIETGEVYPASQALIDEADVIVDALLGTGLKRDVDGEWKQWIDQINASGKPVIAVDIPSGLNASTGAIAGSAIRASETVTFIGLKKGLFTGSGRACCGQVFFDDLDVPEQIYDSVNADAKLLVDRKYLQFPCRTHDTHKGKYGHILIPGGNSGMPGAVMLAAEAALRSGAGVVSVVTLPEHVAAAVTACPEIMVHASAEGEIPESLIDKASHIAIGPGLGQNDWARRLLYQVIESQKPLVLDADALNCIASHPIDIRASHIITPHPGEAARLLSVSPAQIQQDRFAAVEKLHSISGATVVLKGSGSLVYDGKLTCVCPYGNPAMATAGMGDVLTGVITALFAQGLAPMEAAASGVCIHARAAELAADGVEFGLLASDVIGKIRLVSS